MVKKYLFKKFNIIFVFFGRIFMWFVFMGDFVVV